MANKQCLVIEKVSKSYDKNCVVAPFSFSLEKSEIAVLCGGNGAGKSTIIKMVAGLIRPTTGSIVLNGVDGKKDRLKYVNQLGYMPDDFQFQQALTIFEFLQFYASLKKANEYVKETLEMVGLLDKKGQLISKLSKGMRQRLMLAQALVSKPSLLLLDEPTNGLDPQWIRMFNEIVMNTAKQQETTILFSTHNLLVAEEVADHVLFLENGLIKEKVSLKNERDLTKYYKKIFA